MLICEIFDHSMLLGTKSYKHSVDSESLASAKEYSMERPCPVPKEFEDLAVTILKEDKIDPPSNIDIALVVYKHLKSVLNC